MSTPGFGGVVNAATNLVTGAVANIIGDRPYLLASPSLLEVGDEEFIYLRGGETVLAKVLAVDTISHPARARVQCVDSKDIHVVPVLESEPTCAVEEEQDDSMMDMRTTTIYQDYEDSFNLAAGATFRSPSKPAADADVAGVGPDCHQFIAKVAALSDTVTSTSLFKGLRAECQQLVEEFQEKGAAGAFRDAALDACDIVGDATDAVVNGTRSLLQQQHGHVVEEAEVIPIVSPPIR